MSFPTPDQQSVIEHRGAPLVVVAGPGTGKTKTIVARMVMLLREDPARNITFVTFTRTSRKDTLERLTKELTNNIFDQYDIVIPRVGTLHAAASAIVHRFAQKIGLDNNYSIIITDMGERNIIINDTVSDLDVDVSNESMLSCVYFYLCNLCYSAKFGIPEDICKKAIDQYFRLLSFYNVLGMEEIMVSAVNILKDPTTGVPPIFLQVDEYQDLNPVDQQFVSLVASNPASQVVVVGDDAQSIYSRRYAHYEGLRDLWNSETWEKARFLNCHRLPPHIQRAALALIAKHQYLGSEMNPQPDNGKRVEVYQCTKPEYQGEIISRNIRSALGRLTKLDGSPISFSDILVLCPSGTLIPGLLRTFSQNGIPSKQIVKPTIPSDVWKLILIIRIAFHNDNIAFRQWLDISGVPIDHINSLRHSALANNMRLIEYCLSYDSGLPLQIINSAENLKESATTIEKLISALIKFPNIGITDEQLGILGSYLLEEDQSLSPSTRWLGLLYRKFGVLEDENETGLESAVRISSFYSAKGLEAEVVYLSWMNERYMPMADRDIDEQRRLLYVGMTRP